MFRGIVSSNASWPYFAVLWEILYIAVQQRLCFQSVLDYAHIVQTCRTVKLAKHALVERSYATLFSAIVEALMGLRQKCDRG